MNLRIKRKTTNDIWIKYITFDKECKNGNINKQPHFIISEPDSILFQKATVIKYPETWIKSIYDTGVGGGDVWSRLWFENAMKKTILCLLYVLPCDCPNILFWRCDKHSRTLIFTNTIDAISKGDQETVSSHGRARRQKHQLKILSYPILCGWLAKISINDFEIHKKAFKWLIYYRDFV